MNPRILIHTDAAGHVRVVADGDMKLYVINQQTGELKVTTPPSVTRAELSEMISGGLQPGPIGRDAVASGEFDAGEPLAHTPAVPHRERTARISSSVLPILIACLFFASPPAACAAMNYRVMNALALVESGNNPRAIGDRGMATGRFQMHRPARRDAGHSRTTDEQAASAYWLQLQTRLAAALRRPPTVPETFSAWNLGFTGFKRRGFLLERCPQTTRRAALKMERLCR